VGYSLCTLPTTPGCHHVSCPVWAAVEARRGFRQELTSEQRSGSVAHRLENVLAALETTFCVAHA
jgi:hypothetical protein